MVPKQITDAEFTDEVLNSDGSVLVDFYADWCQPCKALSLILDELGNRHNGSLKIVKMDVMKAQSTASSYMISTLPTTMLFKNGTPVDQKIGLRRISEYEDMISG